MIIIGLSLSACAEMQGQWENISTVVGGTAGAYAGQQLGGRFGTAGQYLGGVIGGIAGGVVGKKLGQYLDQRDYQQIAQVTTNPNPRPQMQRWCSTRGFGVQAAQPAAPNPQTPAQTGNCASKNQSMVTVKAQPLMKVSSSEVCRDYTTEVQTPQGQIETVNAKTCRGADGQWKDRSVAYYFDAKKLRNEHA